MSAKKPNQHLENLIKHEDFELLPHWYQKFVGLLIAIGQQTKPTAIYKQSDILNGFITGLFFAHVISAKAYCSFMDLKTEAENYAIKNNVKKAA